jgi:hypothetical protein
MGPRLPEKFFFGAKDERCSVKCPGPRLGGAPPPKRFSSKRGRRLGPPSNARGFSLLKEGRGAGAGPFSRASVTHIFLSPRDLPLLAWMAACASASVLMSTKPKPRVRPVLGSGTMAAATTVPQDVKSALNCASENSKGSRPTNNFLFMHHAVIHKHLHD